MSDVAHTDALAAEYVLGTLDSDEREQARTLLGTDAAFAVKVSQWERRLGELHLMVEPVEPDAGIWARIKSKMPDVQQRSNVRLPEAHIPEPAPAAVPTEAPSLDAIEATISETALALTSEATAAPVQEPADAPASEAVAAATSETIEPAVSDPDALTWSTTEAPVPEPTVEAAPVSVLESPAADLDAAAMPGPPESVLSVPEGTATATLDVTPAPAWHATPTPAAVVEPVVDPVAAPPAVPPSSSAAIVPIPEVTRKTDETARQVAVIRRRLRRWRAFALLMTLVVAAVAALLAAWKFAPERVPPMLQPSEVLRHVGVTPRAAGPLRRPAPPPSHLEE
jgi:anti-sigma-K factor RskA